MKINPNNLMRADTTRSNVLPGNGRGRAGALAPTLFKKKHCSTGVLGTTYSISISI